MLNMTTLKLIPPNRLFPASVQTAQAYVGVSRATNIGQINKFLAVQGLPPNDENDVPYAFCASGSYYADARTYCDLAGVGYTADTAVQVFRALIPFFAQHYYCPSASVQTMVADARRRGIWLDAGDIGDSTTLLPGWKACFDFGNGDHHIEIVKADHGDTWEDVGFNTCAGGHCGVVANKERGFTSLWGFIQTYAL